MDRVVVAVDFGNTMILGPGGKEPIFYLMFELAESDVRIRVDRRTKFDYIWTLAALHDLAVAIQQLHKGDVNHNDIKPENFLVFKDLTFPERMQKLADLGCATSPLIVSLYDDALCAGDPRYAAPEVIYGQPKDAALRTFNARRASDIYHLGSMIFFLVTGRMLTPEIVQRLPPEQRPPRENDDWSGCLSDVLPYWRQASAVVLEDFVARLPKTNSGELTKLSSGLLTALQELGEPNPSLRGHPHNRRANGDPYSVEQYISLFNDLRRFVLN